MAMNHSEREHFERLRALVKRIKLNYIDKFGCTGHPCYLYELLLKETLILKQNAKKNFKGARAKRILLAQELYHYYKKELTDFDRRGTLAGQLFREVIIGCLYNHGDPVPKNFETAVKKALNHYKTI